jgi:hypothetical protein
LLDLVKTLDYKYKVLDPLKLTKDAEHATLGPIAIISTLQQTYRLLISTQDWPALANQLPQSNTSSVTPLKTNMQMKSSQNTVKSASSAVIRCFLCQENHHIRDCPKKPGKLENRKTRGFEAWKYAEPKDLNSTITDAQGRTWKFCIKCVCRYTKRIGMYTLSHGDAEHIDL